MKQLLALFFSIGLILLVSPSMMGQDLAPPDRAAVDTDTSQTKRVKIRNSELLTFQQVGDSSVQKLIGNVQLQQDSTLFFCDSAYLFESINRFEAFGKVRMEMSDSVVLTGKRLEYDGNERIAEVFEDIVLTDQVSTLYTNHIIYYRNEDYGYYDTGGQLEDGQSTLTSDLGYYYPNRDEAFFKGNVRLVNPDYQLETDTLEYDTETKVASFVTTTHITSEDGEITTSRGNYDTQNNKVNLFERSKVQDSTYTLTADTLYYTDEGDLGIARGEVIVMQEDSSLEIRGQRGRFNRKADVSMVTEDPIAIQQFDDDTLYIIADTLLSLKQKQAIPQLPKSDSSSLSSLTEPDSLAGEQEYNFFLGSDSAVSTDTLISSPDTLPQDSSLQLAGLSLTDSIHLDTLGNPIDTASLGPQVARDSIVMDTVSKRLFRAYYQVQLFMNQMQGLADSMVYLYEDSIIYLYGDPVLWAEAGQLLGDTIKIFLKGGEIDSMWVGPNAFLISEAPGAGYNQVKGKQLRASFRDNELARLQIIGNAESLYFIEQDTEDSTIIGYQGLNQAIAQRMMLYFVDNEVNKIVFQAEPEGKFTPFYEVANQENKLEGFRWRKDEQPTKPTDIFPETRPITSIPLKEETPEKGP